MIGLQENTAKEIFNTNINKYVRVSLISENELLEGKLVGISCNTFIIEDKHGYRSMFRYEDCRYLISLIPVSN
jgi:hypothetical protein